LGQPHCNNILERTVINTDKKKENRLNNLLHSLNESKIKT